MKGEDKLGGPMFGDQLKAKSSSLVLSPGLSIECWRDIGERLWRISESSSWWLGDWLVYGQDKYPERYGTAMTESSLDYQTLKNYAWVARKFSPLRRRDKLSLQHHAEVAALSDREQDTWLDLAESHRWSRNELRRQMKAARDGSGGASSLSVFQVQLGASHEQRMRWERAAVRSGLDLVQWIQFVLDQASDSSSELVVTGKNASNP